ncbi:MAG: Fpg/Nei family DNA glycosylase [Actinobacteria bacterium]|nr:Fpg/Nei family DNA glycosylase [Actinomycetota bacterium]
MPELPDVEGFRRVLARHATGQRIDRLTAPSPDVLRNTTAQALGRAVHDRRFGDPGRHGKWLFAHTDDGDGPIVVLHFAMSGFLAWEPVGAPRHRHDRVIFVCSDGELRFNQSRKLGGVWLARDTAERDAITGRLGPDALDVDRGTFRAALDGRKAMIKSALMDQAVLAGLGNLTVDELLWQARVHPRSRLDALDAGTRDRVHETMRDVVAESVRHGRVPALDEWLSGSRDDRQPTCPRCATPLEQGTVSSRTTYWCPCCQQL